jgi:hypothetical protein
VANPGLQVKSCGNSILLTSPNTGIIMLRYFDDEDTNYNNNMWLLCYIVKHFSHILLILVEWRRTTSQAGASATGIGHSHLCRGRQKNKINNVVDSKRNYFFNSKCRARIHLKTDNKLSCISPQN